MPFKIVRNDIAKMQVDAIVNATNNGLQMGGGVCGAIFTGAGIEKLQAECDGIGGCKTGEAVITSAYDLSAKFIIHTVGPVWRDGSHGESDLLKKCYINSLNLALYNKCESIAFPLISSGIFGYPKSTALDIAISAISEFLEKEDIEVYLVVFDRKSFSLSIKRFKDVEKFIDDNYAGMADEISRRRIYGQKDSVTTFNERTASYEEKLNIHYNKKRGLDDIVTHLDETFSEMLLRLIDEKGMTDVQAYKRANIDRKLFSKIRSNKDYKPSKGTAIAFSVALRLSLDETIDLIGRAGFAFSHSSKSDVIIEYFIKEGIYDIHEVNEALFAFDEALLGA
ncbi:MAG: macro domain-containing protein [Clostridia bacterium]